MYVRLLKQKGAQSNMSLVPGKLALALRMNNFTEDMSVEAVGKWLIEKGFSEEVRQSFEREFKFYRNKNLSRETSFIFL